MARSIVALLIATLLVGCSATTATKAAKRGAFKPTTHALMQGVAY
jgi:PBP1b-binding outer membrane lipoprotein LpoB